MSTLTKPRVCGNPACGGSLAFRPTHVRFCSHGCAQATRRLKATAIPRDGAPPADGVRLAALERQVAELVAERDAVQRRLAALERWIPATLRGAA